MLYFPNTEEFLKGEREVKAAVQMAWLVQQLYYLYGERKLATEVISEFRTSFDGTDIPMLWKDIFKWEIMDHYYSV